MGGRGRLSGEARVFDVNIVGVSVREKRERDELSEKEV